MPKVSVIIPIYKVEQYLRRCVDSVLCQTLEDIEIILVDDGSPDQCPQICEEYQMLDSRIRVTHKENGGLASARNAGMRIASGEYIFFVDSDDWIDPDGLQKLYQVAEEEEVDFVRYRMFRSSWPGLGENAPCMLEAPREMPGGYYDQERIKKELFYRLIVTPQMTLGPIVGVCGGLYRRRFLTDNDLRFYEEIKFSEDLIFSARAVCAAKSLYYIEEACVYHYFYNPNSISHSFKKDRWDSCKASIRLFEKDFKDSKIYDFSDQLCIFRWFCIFLSLNERQKIGSIERVDYCKEILSDPLTRTTKIPSLNVKIFWKHRILMFFVKWRWAWVISII